MAKCGRFVSFSVVVAIAISMLTSFLPPTVTAASEDAPIAFVSGSNRVFVHQTENLGTSAKYGLKSESDASWLVSIVDVTNFGTVEQELSLDDFSLIAVDGGKPLAAEANGTPSKQLKLSGTSAKGVATIPVDQSLRVALAFNVPSSVGEKLELAIGFGNETVSIQDTLVESLDIKSLDDVTPWSGVKAELAGLEQNGTLLIGSSESGVGLAGAKAPPLEGCFGAEALAAIESLTGGSIYVENDPSSEGKLVWYWNASLGHLELLNHALVEQGFAGADTAGGSAYATWLTAVEDIAQDEDVGLWDLCRNATGSWINPPTPSAEEARAGYQEIDVRDLVIRPDNFQGDKITLSGEVFSIEVSGGVTFMQIWVTTVDGSLEPVIVIYEEDTNGIYEGTWITVYGVGKGTFSGTNAYGGAITQPVVEADIVDW